MSPESCIYEGTISHRRAEPQRGFRHRLALAYLDLAELPELLGGRLASGWPGMARFRRSDYLGAEDMPLDEAVRAVVGERAGYRPTGPIRLLTHLRSFGHCFNPVSFYYCFGPGGERLDALVAEVTNTPWGERHAYVIPGGSGSFAKALHVSPFQGMEQAYDCQATVPGATLGVQISNWQAGTRTFDATLSLRRRELTPSSLRRMSARYPLATVRVLALTYVHAVGLRLAGAPVFRHPASSR